MPEDTNTERSMTMNGSAKVWLAMATGMVAIAFYDFLRSDLLSGVAFLSGAIGSVAFASAYGKEGSPGTSGRAVTGVVFMSLAVVLMAFLVFRG